MQPLPIELENADQKHAQAVAKLAALDANFEATKELSRAAQRRLLEAQERVTTEHALLRAAQTALTDALENGKSVKDHQQAVAGHRSSIDSLEALVAKRSTEALAADQDIAKVSMGYASAHRDVASTRQTKLIVDIARIIQPAIAISRELRTLSGITGTSFELSGYVLNLQRPQIGPYTVADDGSLSFQLR